MTIPCIVCKTNLTTIQYETEEVHPLRGLHFVTYGHYGSTIFDPVVTSTQLDVVICDNCIINNMHCVRGSGVTEICKDVN